MAATPPRFTLVCVRRLDQEVLPDGGELSLSHDRRLLSRIDEDGRCFCYSCDNTRAEFRLARSVAEKVDRSVWQHIPAETQVELSTNSLSEYPGVACLVALHQENAALTFCRFVNITSPEAELKDSGAELVDDAERLESGAPLLRWSEDGLANGYNIVLRHTIPLFKVLRLLPACREHLAAAARAAQAELNEVDLEGHDADWFEGEECAIKTCQRLPVRISVATAQTMVLLLDDAVATVLTFRWKGLFATSCFYMQRICPSLEQRRLLVRFSDVRTCRDWLFAVTPQPQVRLLMWHISGVAFHALPLGEHLPEDVNFTTLSIARDLLGVALCDDRHRIWVLSLESYFETCPKNLDWELLKERHRCAEGAGVMGQTSKAYQDLTVHPEAFGLRLQDSVKRSSEVAGRSSGRSVMDCLVEGVPTYGISLPGGACGMGDHFLESFEGKGEDERAAGASSSLHRDSGGGGARCMPFTWHERFVQTRGSEWLEVERPQRTFRPMADGRGGLGASIGGSNGPLPKQLLTGFSVPAQHRLGDDDLNYNLCAAVHRHAQRQYQSRLPPWLVKISLPRKAQRFSPAAAVSAELGSVVGEQAEDEGSSSGSELVTEDDSEEDVSAKAAESEASDASLAQQLEPSIPRSSSRKARPGYVELAVTASHVFCEIWEAAGSGSYKKPKDRGPWRLAVLPRSLRTASGSSSWIGGGLEDDVSGGLSSSVAAAASAEEDAGMHFNQLQEAVVAFRSRESWRSLLTQNHIWYLLSQGRSLHVLLLNQSPVRVITNLLIFENRTKAAALCALNDWNPKQLPLLTLFLGLRFRELDEIRQSLGLLRPDQEMQGCQMVMDFIHAGYSCSSMASAFHPLPMKTTRLAELPRPADVPHLPPDRSFVSRLLEQAMQFVTRLVQTRVAQIRECNGACRALTYLQAAHAADEPERYALMVYELTRLTVYMQSLRNIQQQLVRSFGEETACNSGMIVKCQARGPDASGVRAKTGLPSMDAALALAAKLQLGERPERPVPALTAESSEALVRNALMAGRISSALNFFHELKESESGAGDVFEEFRVTAGRLAYQLVCNQQLDFLFVAMHMLRNVGESVNRFFKAVAFHTSKRLVRRRLLRHVGHMRRLTQEEQSLISLVNLLERLYTNPCYTTEFNRMTTGLTTGQYPQRAHNGTVPPFCTWPAGGQPMLLVGLVCDGAIGGHIAAGRKGHEDAPSREPQQANREGSSTVSSHWVDNRAGPQFFEQQTSLRELPMAQRMPLELYDMWSGYQTPAMAAMLDLPAEARRAWGTMPCGDVEDLDATPVLGLSNFHKGSNVVQDAGADIADMREQGDGEGDSEMLNNLESAPGLSRASCRRCRLEGPEDDHDTISPSVLPNLPDGFLEALGLDDAGSKSHTRGYLHVTLGWMRQWSWETRARIVMEKTHFWPRLVEPMAFLQPPAEAGPPAQAWQHCWLDFLVAHQDWRGLAAWVRLLPLRSTDLVNEEGKSAVDLEKFEQRGLRFCTSFSREVLLQQLGRRGIFCGAQSWEALLGRLTSCGKLFGEGQRPEVTPLATKLDEDGEGGVLPLDQLLPMAKMSPFHCFFINFCINNDLPALLLVYLQRYDLATTMSSLKELNIQQSQRPWAPLLLVGRLGNPHLFAASLHHAAFVYMSDIPSDRLREDTEGVPFLPLTNLAESRPIAFLATLMFAPVSSAIELLDSDEDSPWAVDKATLQKAVAAYPGLCEAFFQGVEGSRAKQTSAPKFDRTYRQSLVEAVTSANATRKPLQRGSKDARIRLDGGLQSGQLLRQRPMAVQDMATYKGDISLSTLLSDVAAFDVDRVLERLCIFDESKENEAVDLASLSGPDEKKPIDELEESYFLSQGRAMMAYHVLMTKCKQSLKPGEELRFPLALEPEDARRLRKAAKSVALHNLLNEGVVSSAVCLLELCGLETEKLRVDVEAAKRIYSHAVQNSESGSRSAASVIQLFQSFPDTEEAEDASAAAEAAITSPHLLNALRMLEESTWALDPHPSAPAASIQALGYDLPWHLVALFCRVHSLPRSLTLLHELARNNDWVMFLYESDLQQCPADTVLDIVAGYFTELPLQSHLQILANSIASRDLGESGAREGKGPRGAAKTDSAMPANAIGFLERNRSGSAKVGRGLLQHALLHRKARLAVVASAFSDVSYLQCMAVWLTVNAEKNPDHGEAEESTCIARPSPNPAEVAAQIANLCRKRQAFSLVLRALKIFDPENPLIDFICFHRAFVQCRFKSCREHLRRFVGLRNESGSYSLAFSPHVERLSEEMVWYLLDGFPRARMMLLSALDEAGFSPRFSQLFSAFRLIQQTGLDVDFRVPSAELLQPLISKKMFAEARAWAKNGLNGVAGDTVVFEEVTGMIVEFRQGAWWNVLSERVQLWHKCFDAFMSQCSPPSGSANFFLDIAAKLEPDLYAREQLVLLAIARELLLPSQDKGSHEEQLDQLKVGLLLILTGTTPDLTADLELSPLDLSYKTICSLVKRVPEHVKALPLQGEGALIDIKAKSSFGASGKDGTAGSVLSPQGGPRSELVSFLETGISSLINCDELSLADQVASGFGFESSDQKLAMTLASVAGGKHLQAVRVSPLEPSEAAVAAAESGDAEPLLKELGSHCSPRIALYCRRCMMFYLVSRSIEMDYQEVKKVEPTRLLSLLLSPQPYVADFELCRNLITCFSRPLDATAVAEVLANAFVESMLSNGVMPWTDEKLDEFVGLLSPSQELLGNAALFWIPSFRRDIKVDYASQIAQQVLDPETEVEVLVMAYHSYVQGCCERSVSELLAFLHSRAELYVNRGHFHLLVRLLVAIPEYHAMEYMFGLLVRHGQLQLLLSEGKRTWQDAACKTYGQHSPLAVALIRYLHAHFPLDLEVQVQVHCCFGMEAELAELLETKAGEIAERLGRKWTDICSEEGEEQLILCLSMYLQCARLFLKGKRHQRHLIANERATLICLQLKAVQIHLAASLHEQQNAAAAGQETMDWADVPADGPEALADALLDATGRQKGWADAVTASASTVEGNDQDQDEGVKEAEAPGIVAKGFEGKITSEPAATPSLSLGPAGDVFVVINLMQKEVEVFAEYHQDFIATFEVVSAYRHIYDGLSKVWPKALYRQVVLLGNRSYMQLFLEHLPLTKDWLHAIVQLCLDEPCPEQFPAQMMRMKQFLREGVPNLETRYQLARELGSGFTDIAIETASSVYMT